MSEPRGKEPQNERSTRAEKEADSMFMHWKEHHQRVGGSQQTRRKANDAYLAGDYDLAEELSEETTMQPWGVPRLYQAEAHAMLSTMYDREDSVEQALAAKEQYRRIFLRRPDDPISEKLYSNAHILVRTAQKEAGMTELSPLYEKQPSVETPSESVSRVNPTISVEPSSMLSATSSKLESSIVSTQFSQQESNTPAASVSSRFAASSAATEKTTPIVPEVPQSRRQKRKTQRQGRETKQSPHISSILSEQFAQLQLEPRHEIAGLGQVIPLDHPIVEDHKDLISEDKDEAKANEDGKAEEITRSNKTSSSIV